MADWVQPYAPVFDPQGDTTSQMLDKLNKNQVDVYTKLNRVRKLDASTTAPSDPIDNHLWLSLNDYALKRWNGTSWARAGVIAVSNEAELINAITNIGTDEAVVLIGEPIKLTADLTIPENIQLKFLKGAYIDSDTTAGTFTLTINGGIEAGLYRIFGDNLAVAGSPKVGVVVPQWFGARADGVQDDAPYIQKAVNFFSDVFLPKGRYVIDSAIILNSGNNIFGYSATLDISRQTATKKEAIKVIGELTTVSSLASADVHSGLYSMTVADASLFAEDDWVLLHSEDAYTHYADSTYIVHKGEFLRVRSVDTATNTVYFTTPTVNSYTAANSARITKVNFKENIVIKGITIVGSNTPANNDYGIVLQYVNNFIVKDCELYGQDIYQIEVSACVNGIIANNRLRGVFYDGVTGSIFYGVSVIDSSMYIDIHDNIFDRVRHAIVTSARSNGQGFWGQPLYINIHHNHMYDAEAGGAGTSWAFEHHGFGMYISFNNNVVNGCYAGVNIDAGFAVEVVDNVFTNVTYYGIDLGDTANEIGNIKISGNHISKEINSDASVTSAGIMVRAPATKINDVVISDNFIIGIAGASSRGIHIASGGTEARGIVVKNNTIVTGASGQDADSSYAIVNYQDNVEILSNSIRNYYKGILSTGNNTIIKNNTIKYDVAATAGYGIYIDSSDNVIDGNLLFNPYYGIRIGTTSNNNVVVNNTNKGATIAIVDDGTGTIQVNNN